MSPACILFFFFPLSHLPWGADESDGGQDPVPHGPRVCFPSSQSFHPVTLVSCTSGLLLNIRGLKNNETSDSLDQKDPKKEAILMPCKPVSARNYNSVPDLRSSNPSCSELEFHMANSKIKEVKSAFSVSIVSSAQHISSVETSPDATAPISTSLESLASMSLSTSPECSSPESIHMVSYSRRQQKTSHKLIQERRSKPLMFSKSRQLDLNCASMKNDIKRQYLMSEILQKVQMKKKRPLFPTPKSQYPSLSKERCPHSRSSGRKKVMAAPSVVVLQASHSHVESLNDLLVVATQARLDPRPSRSHSGTTTRDAGPQDPKHTATA